MEKYVSMHRPGWIAGRLFALAIGVSVFTSAIAAEDAPALFPAPAPVPAPLPASVPAPATLSDDTAFLLLRDAVRQDDPVKAEFYAARVGNPQLASYVDYYRLKVRLKDALGSDIRSFLTRYSGSAIAERMRNDWLLLLGRSGDWTSFDEQYRQFSLNDDTQVKCYALQSRVLKGQKVAVEARALLLAPSGYGEACSGLIGALAHSGQFTDQDLWTQVRLAGEFNATGQARRMALLLNASSSKMAQAIDLPVLALARGVANGRAGHEIYLLALGRLARSSTKLGLLALNKALPQLNAQEQALGWASLALAASYALAPEAGEYWLKSAGAPLSQEALQWKTRIALRDGQWEQVRQDILDMPLTLRDDPVWIYWLGRALQEATPGQQNMDAVKLFARIADQTNFYGQLAAEELGRLVTIPPPAAAITPSEIAGIAVKPGFQRALRFFALRLRTEGTREWNWELRSMTEREHLAAAEFARQNNLLDRMVNTSDRTRIEVDFSQRFPAPHNDIMDPSTHTLGLDKAWVYGLIRQESRFIMDAQSSVGASGLMQVMPSTGRYVAKKIGLLDFVEDMLSDVRTNILLGTNYMLMVLGNMDGSQVLATAAYNAGPGRLRSWRATLPGPLEGAIFAETIPFSETRQYVKNVMSNASYYAAMFENKPQSLKARLGIVAPKNALEPGVESRAIAD